MEATTIQICVTEISCENSIDWNACLQTVLSTSSFVLEVGAFILGLAFVSKIRRTAKYGFYFNLNVFITRFKFFSENYLNLTTYLVKEDIRKKCLPDYMHFDQASIMIPQYVSLCKDFLDFIEQAENIVVPKHKMKNKTTKKEERIRWYSNIRTLVEFTHKCQFLSTKKAMYFYCSEREVEQYIKDKEAFSKAISELAKQLEETLGEP